MSIAQDLLTQIELAISDRRVRRLHAVRLDIGAQRLIVPEALQLAFEALARGTVAEGARLELVEIPTEAECRACSLHFAPAIDDYVCPRCGEADVRFVAGNDIILRSLEAETDD